MTPNPSAQLERTQPAKSRQAFAATRGAAAATSHTSGLPRPSRQGPRHELLDAVEQHARRKRCSLVFVASHSFQAPDFYARNGYGQVARIEDHPVGHSNIFFAKRI